MWTKEVISGKVSKYLIDNKTNGFVYIRILKFSKECYLLGREFKDNYLILISIFNTTFMQKQTQGHYKYLLIKELLS